MAYDTASSARGARSFFLLPLAGALLAPAVTGIGLAAGLGQASYETQTAYVVRGEASSGYRAAQTYAAALPEVPGLAEQVGQAAGMSPRAARTNLSAAAIQDTALVRVSFGAPTAEQARQGMAAAVAQLNGNAAAGVAEAPLVQLSPAEEPERVGVGTVAMLLTAALLGALAGLALALARRAVRPRATSVRRVHEVTRGAVVGPVDGQQELELALAPLRRRGRVCVVPSASGQLDALAHRVVDRGAEHRVASDDLSLVQLGWRVAAGDDPSIGVDPTESVVALLTPGESLVGARQLSERLALAGRDVDLTVLVRPRESAGPVVLDDDERRADVGA